MVAIGHVGGCSSLQDIDVQTHNQHVASVSKHAFLVVFAGITCGLSSYN